MKIKSQLLVHDLILRLDAATEAASAFNLLSLPELEAKKNASSWSILECIEHLNLYGRFYLPEISKQIKAGKAAGAESIFCSGILGNYLVNLIKPENRGKKKMKTANAMNPVLTKATAQSLDEFFDQQRRLRNLLQASATADLTAIRTKTSLSPLIRLRLGDTLRFMVHHIERHIAQAQATKI